MPPTESTKPEMDEGTAEALEAVAEARRRLAEVPFTCLRNRFAYPTPKWP
jgi:hypothetical protein